MIERIALIYDDTYKYTTASYCKSALDKLGIRTDYFSPDDVDSIPDRYDLYLNVDEDRRYLLPPKLRPSAYWVIDTNVDYSWRAKKAKMFDFVFASDKRSIENLRRDGLEHIYWLPLACDPDMHKDKNIARDYDISCVGHSTAYRNKYIIFLKKIFKDKKLFFGQAHGDEMANIYSKSKIVFHKALGDAINMRVFEAMSCGALLITSDASKNGETELFGPSPPFVVYYSKRDLAKKIKYYLHNDSLREKIAKGGKKEVLSKHTYYHRMKELVKLVEENKDKLKRNDYAEDITILGDIYGKIFDLINDREKVLDTRCGSAGFSKYLVSRKKCFVTGIEKHPLLAEKAEHLLQEVISGDAADLNLLSKIKETYDVILLINILEYTLHPRLILSRINGLLDKNGRIILAIYNLRYWAVRKERLLKKPDLNTDNKQDRKHGNFFSYYAIRNFFKKSDYSIKHIDLLYGFPLINEFNPPFRSIVNNMYMKKILHTIAKAFPDFFGSQFLFVIERA